tara:strand:- start:260 stop:397 length:138 start_codon:yes stop_codon:yes gene_type:complete
VEITEAEFLFVLDLKIEEGKIDLDFHLGELVVQTDLIIVPGVLLG